MTFKFWRVLANIIYWLEDRIVSVRKYVAEKESKAWLRAYEEVLGDD